MWHRLALIALALTLAACGSLDRETDRLPAESAGKSPSTAGSETKLKPETQRLLSKRNMRVQQTRPLNIEANCSHKDEIGTVTKLNLRVAEAEVKNFDVQVAIKRYGACRFNLDDFEQAEKMPQALLRHKRFNDCTVRMWEEQDHKVTIAFNSCPKSCEGNAFTYLWPILVEAKTGRCF